MANINTSISIDKEFHAKVNDMAIDEDRSFSNQLIRLAKVGMYLILFQKINSQEVTEYVKAIN